MRLGMWEGGNACPGIDSRSVPPPAPPTMSQSSLGLLADAEQQRGEAAMLPTSPAVAVADPEAPPDAGCYLAVPLRPESP